MKLVPALLIVVLAASASMASTWTLTTADFAQRDGDLVSLGVDAVEIRQVNAQRVPWREVVSLVQGAVTPQVKQPFVLATRDGQSLAGKPVKIADEKLHWESDSLGTVQVPLEQVRGVARAGVSFPSPANEDVAVLRNGDVVRGVVDAADSDALSIQKGADKSPIRWEAINVLMLADVGGTTPPALNPLRVRLADGSTCLATQVRIDGDQIHLQRGKAEDMHLPLAAVVAIENLGGRAKFLGALRPAEQRYSPYIAPPSPVAGIRFTDDAQLRNIIELRPRSTISYVAPADGTLHLRYACADAGQLTDMALQITAGGKVLLKQEGIRSSSLSQPVDVPVQKGQTIVIMLDYGSNYDVQDTLRLLDAAFVEKP